MCKKVIGKRNRDFAQTEWKLANSTDLLNI
jgi:hypothetical protein